MWKKLSSPLAACLLCIGFFATHAKADSYPCKSVRSVALLYMNHALAVTELHDDENNECIYSINGATSSDVSEKTLNGIKESLGNLGYLLNYARRTLPEGNYKDFEEVILQIPTYIVYLVSSPRLVDGNPPAYLEELVKKNSNIIMDCFKDFFVKGDAPPFKSSDAFCRVSDEKKDALEMGFQHKKFSHVLHIFR